MLRTVFCQVKVNWSILTSNNLRGGGRQVVMMTFFESGSNIQISCSLLLAGYHHVWWLVCVVLFGAEQDISTSSQNNQGQPGQAAQTVRWDLVPVS